MSDVLGSHDATALAKLVSAGEVSPLELAEASIARIEAADPQLNAVIHPLFEKAIAAATDPEGLPDGPFRGVPFVIKDLWAASAGDPMHNGMAGMKADNYITAEDSALVALYRAAGFNFVGRTNTPELGLVATTEPLSHGPCRNPWNTDFGTGGSSGGSAAAVAAGFVPVGNASDGGGSIRIPAAMCGLVGLKPSRGRVPMGPYGDEGGVSVQHVVSMSVRDSAAILDASCTHPAGAAVIAPGPTRPYAAEVGADPGKLRVAVMPESPREGTDADPESAALARRVGGLLESLGHHVFEATPPMLGDQELIRQFLATWSVGAAYNLDRIGTMLGRELTNEDVEPGTWEMAQWGANASGLDLMHAQGAHARFRRLIQQWFADNCDVMVTPTCAAPPPPIGTLTPTADDPHRGSGGSIPYAVFTSPFNVSGQPGISLPMGMTESGLPIGVQLVGQYGAEDVLIRVASQLETAEPWAGRLPPLHPNAVLG